LLERLAELDCAVGNHLFEALAVGFDLLLEMPFVEGTLKAGKDSTLRKGLDEIVVGTEAHSSHAHVDVVDARSDHEGHVRVQLANTGQELEARHPRHFEVGNDGIEALALESDEGFVAAAGGGAGISGRTQHHRKKFGSGALVVDRQDAYDGRLARGVHTKGGLGLRGKRAVNEGH
jgi:hypothetical protein